MPTVLVVDDAATVRSYYCSELAKSGFDSVAAVNGADALEHCIEQEFALLIVDINMPVMDGYTFLTTLRSHPDSRSAATPVVVVSTEDRPEDAERAYAAGANAYLPKPVSGEQLSAWARLLTGVSVEPSRN